MNIMRILLIALSCVLLFACEHNEQPEINSEELLLGNWAEPVYDDGTITFKRVVDLPTNDSGIAFEEKGVFKQSTSGWCGTPPLTYFLVEGTWVKNDNLVKVETNGYPERVDWKVVDITISKLVLKVEMTEQEKDHQALMDLFDEIVQLAESVNCTDSSEWKFTAYGAKACGGPQGYIAYNIVIDEHSFLEKIQTYTEAEKAYNIKWNIVSDCSMVATPTHVVCENNKAILKY